LFSHCRRILGQEAVEFGGVVNAVLHNLTRPTLVLRVRLQVEKGEVGSKDCACDPLQHVLFPTDFSDNAERAFAYVRKIADCQAKRVTLMHVQNQSRIEKASEEQLAEMNRIDSERLERLKTDLEGRGVGTVDIDLPYGLPKGNSRIYAAKGSFSRRDGKSRTRVCQGILSWQRQPFRGSIRSLLGAVNSSSRLRQGWQPLGAPNRAENRVDDSVDPRRAHSRSIIRTDMQRVRVRCADNLNWEK
jgi:hypothetical protein